MCLQFADDILIFSSADKQYINNIKLMGYSFELVTNLKLNFGKSSIYSRGASKSFSHNIMELLGFTKINLSINCLGIALHFKKPQAANW